jgi:hypothetical protein
MSGVSDLCHFVMHYPEIITNYELGITIWEQGASGMRRVSDLWHFVMHYLDLITNYELGITIWEQGASGMSGVSDLCHFVMRYALSLCAILNELRFGSKAPQA